MAPAVWWVGAVVDSGMRGGGVADDVEEFAESLAFLAGKEGVLGMVGGCGEMGGRGSARGAGICVGLHFGISKDAGN